MTSLSFPDINVWLALATDHVHRDSATEWWNADQSEVVAFSRFTQIGFLRLLTTSAVMAGKPLSMRGAWDVFDRFMSDARVSLVSDPSSVDTPFRQRTSSRHASPKLWTDAYLIVVAEELGATLITFDRALARRSPKALLLS